MNISSQSNTQLDSLGKLHQTSPSPEWDGVNRRFSGDRRSFTVATLYTCLTSPRRFRGRRSSDRRFAILDKFDSGIGFMALGLMFLSILDSVFTLSLIAAGGSEVNPFMNWLLGYSLFAFVGVKMILTAIPALILVATGNLLVFGYIRARSILAAMVGMYAGLIFYEIALLKLAYF